MVGEKVFGCHQLQVDRDVSFGVDVEVRTCCCGRGVRLKAVIWKKEVRVKEDERAKFGGGGKVHVEE